MSITKELNKVESEVATGGWGFATTTELYRKYCFDEGKPITIKAFISQLHHLEKINMIESKSISGGSKGALVWRMVKRGH